jgi:hypothetical protein
MCLPRTILQGRFKSAQVNYPLQHPSPMIGSLEMDVAEDRTLHEPMERELTQHVCWSIDGYITKTSCCFNYCINASTFSWILMHASK